MTKQIKYLLSLIVVLAACGGSDATQPSNASMVDTAKGRELVRASDQAKRQGHYDKARTLLKEARQHANAELRHEIDYSLELIDKAHAKTFATDITAFAEDGKCEEAISDTVAVIGRGEGLASFIRKFTSKPIRICLVALVEQNQLKAAAALVSGDETAKALYPKDLKIAKEALRNARASRVENALRASLDQHAWGDALQKLRELVDQGEASQDMYAAVLSKIRSGIVEDIDTLYQDAAAKSANASKALQQLDALLALGWPTSEDGANQKPPEDVASKRNQLAFLSACHSLRCRTNNPQKRWSYGELAVKPISGPKSAALDKPLPSGVAVWEVAVGGGLSLIALKDLNELVDSNKRAAAAHGWVKSSGLKSQDTSEWLPPGKSLLGTRVWGPLRKGESLYELGTVTKIGRAKVSVRRLSDRREEEVARSRLRFGLVKKGLKVMGYCKSFTKLEPALIDQVKETQFEQQGDPLVTLDCIDKDGQPTGKKKEGQLGSLRIEAGWLPPRR